MAKIVLTVSASGIIFSTVYYLSASSRVAQFRAASAAEDCARVAILKPLRGVSQHLRENIVSFLEIAYSRVEYLFGASSYEDRAIDVPVSLRLNRDVVRRILIQHYRPVQGAMVLGGSPSSGTLRTVYGASILFNPNRFWSRSTGS
jgi:hypothetical protein